MAILLSLVLLAANGFFVGAEFALIAARRTRMEQLAAQGSFTAKVAMRSMRELSLMLSASQLGITMASLGLGYVAEPAVAHGLEAVIGRVVDLPEDVTHSVALVIALSVVVYLHMVIGEMVPKNIAISVPERSAQLAALPMRGFVAVLRPGIAALNGIANGTLRLLGVEARDELTVAHTADEIARMVSASREEGLIDHLEHGILARALAFRDREVSAVMIHLDEVVSIEDSTSTQVAEKTVRASGHSRIPVFDSGRRDMLGFVHAKDLLRVAHAERERPVPRELIRPLPAVGVSDKLHAVLARMRQSRTHFAVAVDLNGRPVGIVTLEDVLEELVGDISDEHDARRTATTSKEALVAARIGTRWPRPPGR